MSKLTKEARKLNCRKCGKEFRVMSKAPFEVLCSECIAQLPRCFGCGVIISPDFGYTVRSFILVGDEKLCPDCVESLETKGYLNFGQKIAKYQNGTWKIELAKWNPIKLEGEGKKVWRDLDGSLSL